MAPGRCCAGLPQPCPRSPGSMWFLESRVGCAPVNATHGPHGRHAPSQGDSIPAVRRPSRAIVVLRQRRLAAASASRTDRSQQAQRPLLAIPRRPRQQPLRSRPPLRIRIARGTRLRTEHRRADWKAASHIVNMGARSLLAVCPSGLPIRSIRLDWPQRRSVASHTAARGENGPGHGLDRTSHSRQYRFDHARCARRHARFGCGRTAEDGLDGGHRRPRGERDRRSFAAVVHRLDGNGRLGDRPKKSQAHRGKGRAAQPSARRGVRDFERRGCMRFYRSPMAKTKLSVSWRRRNVALAIRSRRAWLHDLLLMGRNSNARSAASCSIIASRTSASRAKTLRAS